MTDVRRYTSADLASFPDDDGKRYEIIDGELFVSTQPTAGHQMAITEFTMALGLWNRTSNAGKVMGAPGVIFSDDNDVAPDLIWISNERYAATIQADGHFHGP